MRPLVQLSTFAALLFGSAIVMAQQGVTTPPAPMPAASMPMDCPGGAVKRHDHGAERNAPSSASTLCAPKAAASPAKTKAKPTHDHAKFHKNQ